MEAYILVRRDGRDDAVRRPRFLSQFLFFIVQIPVLLENPKSTLSAKTNLCYGFTGNRLGQNVRIDREIISGVHQKSDFDRRFACRSLYFSEHINFHFLCLNNLFLSGGQRYDVQNIEYN